jgi:hypothetical protein
MNRFLAVLLRMSSISVAATDVAPTVDEKAAKRFARLRQGYGESRTSARIDTFISDFVEEN